MPKGQKFIDWTPENDAKLLVTILAVENVHPNCENVAAAFGEPCLISKENHYDNSHTLTSLQVAPSTVWSSLTV